MDPTDRPQTDAPTPARAPGEDLGRLRAMAMEASRAGVVISDARAADQPIVHVNRAFEALTGYSAAEAVGRNCRFLQGGERDQPGLDELRAALAEGRGCTVLLRNFRKDGSLFWNELHVAALRQEDGTLTHFVGIQTDVTARVRAEEELRARNAQLHEAKEALEAANAELTEATRAKDRFMATMSHEMRTPLNAVLGHAELMEMGIAGELSPGQRGHLERIRRSGRGLLELINDVLDVARSGAGRLEVRLRAVRVRGAVEEAMALVEPQAQRQGLRLSARIPDDCPAVAADLRRLRQILANLLSNAVKFTERGEVVVDCRTDGDTVAVEVRDTGIGMAPEQLAQVFEEFYQADSALTREFGGSGLGLSISRRLARLMGGDITAESVAGQGSVFRLVLPAATEAEARAAPANGQPGAPRDAGATAGLPAVVVYGSSRPLLENLGRRLAPRVRIVGSTNAGEVPDLVRREHPTLVVLDVTCSDGAGWQVASELRKDPELDDVATLLLPCLADEVGDGGPPGALDLGWVAIVPKPIAAEQLALSVRRARRDEDGDAPYEVLVVDDDPDARRIAARVLTSTGARVREAVDGERGLVEMRIRRPSVAVLDLMMPVLDGFGVLAAMRADPSLRDIPVVVLTAKDLSEAERSFLARTAEGVLEKGEQPLSDVATLILRAAEAPAALERTI